MTVWTCSKEMISFEFVLRNAREGKAKEFLLIDVLLGSWAVKKLKEN